MYGCARLTPTCARGLRERSTGFALRRINHAGCYKLSDERFRRVLYLDIDIHHGDGVQDAFWYSDQVLFVSFHHYARGFFPGTGAAGEVGQGGGYLHTLNLPLKGGCGDASFLPLFRDVLSWCRAAFRPDAVVLCCGADSLGVDPIGNWNLTSHAIAAAVRLTLTGVVIVVGAALARK